MYLVTKALQNVNHISCILDDYQIENTLFTQVCDVQLISLHFDDKLSFLY